MCHRSSPAFLFKVFEFGHNRPPKRRNVMFLTTSNVSFRGMWIKCLTVVIGTSSAFSGMTENSKLSLMLQALICFIFIISLVIPSLRDFTNSLRAAFSGATYAVCSKHSSIKYNTVQYSFICMAHLKTKCTPKCFIIIQKIKINQ